MRKKYISLFIAIIILSTCYAQTNHIYSSMIHTLQTIVNDDWMQPAVITLNTDDYVTISFDHFTHDYHRFSCHLIHCNSDWKPSELLEVEYMDGFNDRPIESYENSLNTTFLYTHYSVEYPNDELQLKASGNYIVYIYDEEADNDPDIPSFKDHPIVAVACFRVVEPKVDVMAEVSSNTDIDTHAIHQQVSFSISHSNYTISRPNEELQVIVCQNNRPDMMVTDITPTYVNPGKIDYVNNRALIFPGNNEYRRFEIINMHYGSQNVNDISFFNPYYHAELIPDTKRSAYSFDADHNGRYFIRYNRAENSDIEADYLFVHFSLEAPYPFNDGTFYLAGKFSEYEYTPEYQMKYNPSTSLYECSTLLKLGSYDYQFVCMPHGEEDKIPMPITPVDGCFFETENEYTIYVYHRPFGDRYEHLIAVKTIDFAQQ